MGHADTMANVKLLKRLTFESTIIFETIPAPNQTINIGAKANIGITCEAITYGKKDFSKFLYVCINIPIITPKKIAKNKPIKISIIVVNECFNRKLFEFINSSKIIIGDGKSQVSKTSK